MAAFLAFDSNMAFSMPLRAIISGLLCMVPKMATSKLGARSSNATTSAAACHPILKASEYANSVQEDWPHRCMLFSRTLLRALSRMLDLALFLTCRSKDEKSV
jgi:hypothetical protein